MQRRRVEELRAQLFVAVTEPELAGADVDEAGGHGGAGKQPELQRARFTPPDLERVDHVREAGRAGLETIRTRRHRRERAAGPQRPRRLERAASGRGIAPVPLERERRRPRADVDGHRSWRAKEALPAAVVVAVEQHVERARAVGAPQLIGKQVILDDQVRELAAQIGAVRIQHQRRLVGLLGARVRALDFANGRERPLPQRLALNPVATVERGERPLPQLAQSGGTGPAVRARLRGGSQVCVDLPLQLLPPVVDRLHAHDQRGQDHRHADPRQEPPPVAVGGIVLERDHQRRHRRPALARFGAQALPHQRCGAYPKPQALRGPRKLEPGCRGATVVEHLQQRLAGERAFAIERLVEGHAEAELVAALAGGLGQDLLGGHVGGRANQSTRAGQRAEVARARRTAQHRSHCFGRDVDVARLQVGHVRVAREAEVDDARAPFLVQQHVLRF